MHGQRLKELGAEWLAAWNRGDADGVVARVVDDVIWHDVALPMPLHGREAMHAAVQAYMNAFPDLHMEVSSETVQGPRLVQEWTTTATHRGELMGMAPTGRATRSYGVTVTTYDDEGQLIEGTVYWNPLAMLHQLGLLPAPQPVVMR
jgi:steroid delta-isomerase-like uncharacterized protein